MNPTPRRLGLTSRMKDCFDAIETHITVHGCSPSYLQLQNALTLGSKSTVCRLVYELRQRGWQRHVGDRHDDFLSHGATLWPMGEHSVERQDALLRNLRSAVATDQPALSPAMQRIVEAFECGAIVNPDELRNQIVGGSIAAAASIGVAVSTPDTTADDLLADADASMYRAKQARRSGETLFIILKGLTANLAGASG